MVLSFQKNLLEKIQEVEGKQYTKLLFEGDHVIYGLGGLNRYYINVGNIYDGFELNEVVFSAFHSNEGGREKARRAGFSIFV